MVPVTWNSNGNDIKMSIFWIVLDLVDRYGISVTQMTTDMFTCRKHFPFLSLFMTYYRVCNWNNTTDATSGAGTTYPFGAHEFPRI